MGQVVCLNVYHTYQYFSGTLYAKLVEIMERGDVCKWSFDHAILWLHGLYIYCSNF
jgi:hypothetical protein